MSAMKRLVLLGTAALLALAAWAQEAAFTNRSTDLKETASAGARTVATLPENTSVKVIARGGGWTRVEANGQSGFVNVFHLRFPVAVESSSTSSSGLGAITGLFGGKPAPQKTTIATTGIRGLTADDLQNASPNPEALAKAQGYRSDKPAAERFAKDGKLVTASVDYKEGGRR
jgi:hypothetical protein